MPRDTFPNIEAYWEYIKAQGCQVARVWNSYDEESKNFFRRNYPSLAANLDALRAGYDMKVDS